MKGSPVDGGHYLIRNDPFTTGQQRFQVKCAGCHSFTADATDKFESMKGGVTASDLGGRGRECQRVAPRRLFPGASLGQALTTF